MDHQPSAVRPRAGCFGDRRDSAALWAALGVSTALATGAIHLGLVPTVSKAILPGSGRRPEQAARGASEKTRPWKRTPSHSRAPEACGARTGPVHLRTKVDERLEEHGLKLR